MTSRLGKAQRDRLKTALKAVDSAIDLVAEGRI
jgi:hypothetical protein